MTDTKLDYLAYLAGPAPKPRFRPAIPMSRRLAINKPMKWVDEDRIVYFTGQVDVVNNLYQMQIADKYRMLTAQEVGDIIAGMEEVSDDHWLASGTKRTWIDEKGDQYHYTGTVSFHGKPDDCYAIYDIRFPDGYHRAMTENEVIELISDMTEIDRHMDNWQYHEFLRKRMA